MSNMQRLLSLAAVLMFMLGSAPVCLADTNEAVRESLTRQDFPWYDSQGDQLKRLGLPPPVKRETPKNPQSTPASPTPSSTGSSSSSSSSSSSTSSSSSSSYSSTPNTAGSASFASTLSYVFLTLLVLLILAGLAYVLARWTREQTQEVVQKAAPVAKAINRVAELPIDVDQRPEDLFTSARKMADNGDFRTACIYLYSHLLLTLDERQWIRLARGKTNRQYLRELKKNGPPQGVPQLFSEAMNIFEQTLFGEHTLDRRGFDAFVQDFQQLERLAGKPV
jgi:hypothetical protein